MIPKEDIKMADLYPETGSKSGISEFVIGFILAFLMFLFIISGGL